MTATKQAKMNGLLGVTFRGTLWHGYSCSWTPAALWCEHLLTFFLQKVDIEWRNLCSIYSSNKVEHISEIIFQFHVVLWPSDANSFTLKFRHYRTSDTRTFSEIGKSSMYFLVNWMTMFQNWYHSIWKSILNNNLKLLWRVTGNIFVKLNVCLPRFKTQRSHDVIRQNVGRENCWVQCRKLTGKYSKLIHVYGFQSPILYCLCEKLYICKILSLNTT